MSEFHAEALQAIVSEGLAQGAYLVARAGFELTTLRTKGVDSTNGTCKGSVDLVWACGGRDRSNIDSVSAVDASFNSVHSHTWF